MKIEIFAKTGKVEVDNVNALISMVQNGEVKPDTVIGANGKKVEAKEVRELKPFFETFNKTENEPQKTNETNATSSVDGGGEVQRLRESLAFFQSKIAQTRRVKNRIFVVALFSEICVSLYLIPTVLLALLRLGYSLSTQTNSEISISELQMIAIHDANCFSVAVSIVLAAIIHILHAAAAAIIERNAIEYGKKEVELAKSLREALLNK